LLCWWLLKNEANAWIGIGEIKDCDGKECIWRLREGTTSVKLGNVKSSLNNDGKILIGVKFSTTQGKLIIFWKGFKGTILVEMIREEWFVHWKSNIDVFSLIIFVSMVETFDPSIFTCHVMKKFLIIKLSQRNPFVISSHPMSIHFVALRFIYLCWCLCEQISKYQKSSSEKHLVGFLWRFVQIFSSLVIWSNTCWTNNMLL
jgi:hypothetical protein